MLALFKKISMFYPAGLGKASLVSGGLYSQKKCCSPTVPQKVTFGDRVFAETMQLKWPLGWTLIQRLLRSYRQLGLLGEPPT